MKQNNVLFLLFLTFVLFSCDSLTNHEIDTINCDKLQSGIIDINVQTVSTEVNKLLKDLKPQISGSDRFGHKENLDKLIERINSQCGEVTADLICYACIETNPPQSEILVTTDSSGTLIYRTLDIRTPDDDIMSCVNVHRYYVNKKE